MPDSPTSQSFPARAYLNAIVFAGAIAVWFSLRDILATPPKNDWYWLVALTLLSGILPVKLPSVAAIISVSETFVFAGTLIFGQAVGTVLVLLDAVVISAKVVPKNRQVNWTKVPFNLAAPPLSIWIASTVLFRIAGPPPLALGQHWSSFVLGLGVFTALYFLLNSGFIALAIALQRGRGVLDLLRDLKESWWSIKAVFWNYLAGASIAALLVSGEPTTGITHTISLKFLLVILPLMIVLHLTYRHAAQMVGEIQLRLDSVEKVHMATIAAFSMAIDAKDQVTHGHVRRVQRYTMELAKSLGVTDERHLKALEAAALLHDTGKLAVPEYILNKPGPLTASEFEKMKDHATVGANILRSIEFPYPVEPIVRHHHESWDGSGYPDGIKGPDIPLGARILAVVDCYDALTSDRPYRPRMTRIQAEQVLRDRRGTMYDPWIVESFLKILDNIERLDEAEARSSARTSVDQLLPFSISQLDVISAATAEEREFAELRRELPRATSRHAAAEVFFRHVRRVIPASSVAMYVPTQETNDLLCIYAAGVGASTLEYARVPIGERIAGWAFAHTQMVSNSDASLDLGPVARTLSVALRYALVAPLCEGKHAIAVVALYGTDMFHKDHTRMLESAAALFASSVAVWDSGEGGTMERPSVRPFRKLH